MKKCIYLLFVSLLFVACDKFWPRDNIENYDVASDTEDITTAFERVVNPEFYSIGDVLDYRYTALEKATIDSTFLAMPEKVLKDVATVLLNRSLQCTKKTIVKEYSSNKQVYDNLPKSSNEIDLRATDLGTREDNSDYELASTEYEYFIDSITGKKVQIKKENYVSK